MKQTNKSMHRLLETMPHIKNKDTIENLLDYLDERDIEIPPYAIQDIARAIEAGNTDYLNPHIKR